MSEKPKKPSADKLKLRKATAKDLTVSPDQAGKVKAGRCIGTVQNAPAGRTQ